MDEQQYKEEILSDVIEAVAAASRALPEYSHLNVEAGEDGRMEVFDSRDGRRIVLIMVEE